LRLSYCNWRYNIREAKRVKGATKPAKGELFNISGYGPSKPANTLVAAPYHGPLYPAPSYEKYNPHKSRSHATDVGMTWCNTARREWSEKRLQNAEQAYEKAIKACPANPDLLFEDAQLLWSEGRLQEARNCLERALEIDPHFASAR